MSGAQMMVVMIVALVMLTGIIKSALYARHGGPRRSCGPRDTDRPNRARAERDDTLNELNARLDQVIDRLAVLEKIVTDEDRDLRRKFADLDSKRDDRPTA